MFEPEPILNKALSKFADFDLLGVLLVDEEVSFKKCNWRLNANFARVTLATQVEHDHRNAKELSIAAYISRHGYL